MRVDSDTLQQAISQIEQEQSLLEEEQSAFENFRETVRLTVPGPPRDNERSGTAEQLREAYREQVMNELDYGAVYGDSLEESLEQELSPSIANFLLSDAPITQRQKRKLLVESSVAVERRESFIEDLNDEEAAIEGLNEELTDIKSSIKKLPKCSLSQQPLEELLEIREQYAALKDRCEQLLLCRQKQMRAADRNVGNLVDFHALNEYLYAELETCYPVLSAATATIELIDSELTPDCRSACETSYEGSTEFDRHRISQE